MTILCMRWTHPSFSSLRFSCTSKLKIHSKYSKSPKLSPNLAQLWRSSKNCSTKCAWWKCLVKMVQRGLKKSQKPRRPTRTSKRTHSLSTAAMVRAHADFSALMRRPPWQSQRQLYWRWQRRQRRICSSWGKVRVSAIALRQMEFLLLSLLSEKGRLMETSWTHFWLNS